MSVKASHDRIRVYLESAGVAPEAAKRYGKLGNDDTIERWNSAVPRPTQAQLDAVTPLQLNALRTRDRAESTAMQPVSGSTVTALAASVTTAVGRVNNHGTRIAALEAALAALTARLDALPGRP